MLHIKLLKRLSPSNPKSIHPFSHKPISLSTLPKTLNPNQKNKPINASKKKQLDVLFKQALGLIPKPQINEEKPNGSVTKPSKIKALVELEEELKELVKNQRGKGGESKGKSLYDVFTQKSSEERRRKRGGDEEEVNMKEFSSDVERFVRHLYDEGYFRDVNFLPGMRFDIGCFEDGYARGFLKSAAEKFGKDNQEIAGWLSGSDLKTVALFGCPSLSRRNVFVAKGLRRFFNIAEDTICQNCILRERCKYKNQNVWGDDYKNLNLSLFMRLLLVYAMEVVSPPLVLSNEVKACVNRLLNETIKLSKTIS